MDQGLYNNIPVHRLSHLQDRWKGTIASCEGFFAHFPKWCNDRELCLPPCYEILGNCFKNSFHSSIQIPLGIIDDNAEFFQMPEFTYLCLMDCYKHQGCK